MPWPTILPPGLPVVEGIRPTVIILLAHSAVYVAGGGDIIVILSPRVLSVWGTIGFGVKVGGFRIIFGLDGLKVFEVVSCYLKNVWFLI